MWELRAPQRVAATKKSKIEAGVKRTMATVITVMNMKGGVGKTTVAIHLGGCLTSYIINPSYGYKVLLIDYDPQFNLSQAYLKSKAYFALEDQRRTTLGVLLGNEELNPYQLQVPGNHEPPKVADIAHPVFRFNNGALLDLVPSTLDLMYVALGQSSAQLTPMEERFSKFISECREVYDVVIIDCHPAGSIFTKTSLRNSDHVIIPVMPQRYSVRGIGLMLNFIEAKKQGSTGPTPHILFNAVPRVGITAEEAAIRANPRFGDKCLANTLKRLKAFAEPEEGAGFVWKSKKPYSGVATKNLLAVVHEIHNRLGIKAP